MFLSDKKVVDGERDSRNKNQLNLVQTDSV